MSRPLKCPKCGASTDNGDSFTGSVVLEGEWTVVINSTNEDDALEFDGCDFTAHPRSRRVEVRCDECRHDFVTLRPYRCVTGLQP